MELTMPLEREHINPPGLYRHPSFTRVVTVSGPMKLVFIAGQTPTDEQYRVVAPGDYRAQYRQVMENLDVQLKAAGATWRDVVYRRVFTLDVDALIAAFRADAGAGYGDADAPPPGSTLIGVTRLSDPAALVEIDLLAVVEAGDPISGGAPDGSA
jgi:enamine deaminase RidA (YjgF/YER057c/UK114 family)